MTNTSIMKNIQFPVYFTSLVLAFYAMTPYLGVPYALVSTLFLALNVMIIWMVVRVLKDGVPSQHTWEETWYDDYSDDQ